VSDQKSNLPFVSVLLAIRNEAGFIRRSLGAILQQDYPSQQLEVLIADGMSEDETRNVVLELQAAYPAISVRVFDNPKKVVAAGLNTLLSQTRGEVIVRVDGHTIIAPDYIRQCVKALQRTGADNVGGRMDPVAETRFGEAVAGVTSSPFGVGGARFHYSTREEWVDTVYLGAWPRHVFKVVGNFDEEQVRNQDDEFNYRLLRHGGRILLSPRIKSWYYNRSTLGSLWRQYFQYGFWKVRVMQKHPSQMRLRQFVPPAFVASLLFSLTMAAFSRIGVVLFACALGSYTIANVAASVTVAQSGNRRLLPLLMLGFATIHVAYGLGFLTGLLRFANRRWPSQDRTNLNNVELYSARLIRERDSSALFEPNSNCQN
jgi:succinoglycan biosynthesis protein ExoA